jgi:hypothetical protein
VIAALKAAAEQKRLKLGADASVASMLAYTGGTGKIAGPGWLERNSGNLITAGAIGVCLVTGPAGCAAATAVAWAARAENRARMKARENGGGPFDHDFAHTWKETAADGALTVATFGLTTAPAAGAEQWAGNTLAVNGSRYAEQATAKGAVSRLGIMEGPSVLSVPTSLRAAAKVAPMRLAATVPSATSFIDTEDD